MKTILAASALLLASNIALAADEGAFSSGNPDLYDGGVVSQSKNSVAIEVSNFLSAENPDLYGGGYGESVRVSSSPKVDLSLRAAFSDNPDLYGSQI